MRFRSTGPPTLLALATLSAIFGCKSNGGSSTATPANPAVKTLTIGFSMDTLKEERWQRDRDLFVAKAEPLAAKGLVQAAHAHDAPPTQRAEKEEHDGPGWEDSPYRGR